MSNEITGWSLTLSKYLSAGKRRVTWLQLLKEYASWRRNHVRDSLGAECEKSSRNDSEPSVSGFVKLGGDGVAGQHELAQLDLLEIIKLLEVGDIVFLHGECELRH